MIHAPLRVRVPDDLFDREHGSIPLDDDEILDDLPEDLPDEAWEGHGDAACAGEPPLDHHVSDPSADGWGVTKMCAEASLTEALYRRLLDRPTADELFGAAGVTEAVETSHRRIVLGEAGAPWWRDSLGADERLSLIAAELDWFERAGRPFFSRPYERPYFLDCYLVYYASRTSLQIQLALADLVRTCRLPSDLRVLDLGTGPGVTALAVFDFLRHLAGACAESGHCFPINDVRIFGIDRSSVVIDYAKQTSKVFATAFADEASRQPGVKEYRAALDRVVQWTERVEWAVHDLRGRSLPTLPFAPTLLVASNSLSEILNRFQCSSCAIDRAFDALAPGGSAIVIEHDVWHDCLDGWLKSVWDERRDLKLAMVEVEPEQRPNARRRRQEFSPHSLFCALVERVPSLAPMARQRFGPGNDALAWSEVLFHRPA